MVLRILEISASDSYKKQLHDLAENRNAIDWWYSAKNKDNRRTTRILVNVENQQELMDDIQTLLYKENNWRLLVLPVEATMPVIEENKKDVEGNDKKRKNAFQTGTITREELYAKIAKGAKLDINFVLLAVLSVIVATIGLIQDNAAVVIGAMVIAPFLGPILALAFAAAVGDKKLTLEAIKTNLAGMVMTVIITIGIGLLISSDDLANAEITSRTLTGYDSIILALASGAAAVLSLSSGISSALVGVMVAVALLPPAATAGLMIGTGLFGAAFGALLLLLTNIVCVGLSAQLIFLLKGVKPRTWYMRKKSEQSVRLNFIIWAALLTTLIVIITVRLYMYS